MTRYILVLSYLWVLPQYGKLRHISSYDLTHKIGAGHNQNLTAPPITLLVA